MRFLRSHIVGVLALVLALAGTATAAVVITGADIKDGSVTGTDIKNGSLTLRDLKQSEVAKLRGGSGGSGSNGRDGQPGAQGERGAVGPTGPAGAKGDKGDTGAAGVPGATGATGAKGDTGDAGANGANGAAGASAFGPPPSGQLITGGGVFTGYGGTNNEQYAYVALPFTLATAIDDAGAGRNLYFAGSNPAFNAGENDGSCAGDVSSPNPDAGVVCLYIGSLTNVRTTTGEGMYLKAGSLEATGEASERTGFTVGFQTASGPGVTFVRYVWAYKAP